MILGGVDIIIIEIKYTINVMHLDNHVTTPGPWKNLSSMKLVSGAKKIGDHCLGYYL